MIPPDLSAGLCRSLSPRSLEATFHYPGPTRPHTAPSAATQRQWDMAKEVCLSCPVMLRCAEVYRDEQRGIYGATDEHERYMKRRREAGAARAAIGWTGEESDGVQDEAEGALVP